MKLSARVGILLGVWLAGAIALGASGRMATLRPPGPQVVLLALTLGLLLLERRGRWLREWVASADISQLTALHLTRFVGIAFLLLGSRGVLPAAFAVPAGWGDIAVATAALVLILGRVAPLRRGRRLLVIWNVAGLLDLALVVVTAAGLAMTDPGSMHALLRLPLSLLPTFLVPLLLASHIWMLRRLSEQSGR